MKKSLLLSLVILAAGAVLLSACSGDDENITNPPEVVEDQRAILLIEEIPPFTLDIAWIADLVAAGLPGSDPDFTPVFDAAGGTWMWSRAEGESDTLMFDRWSRTLDVAVTYRAGDAPVMDRAAADRVEITLDLDYRVETYDPDKSDKNYAARTMTLALDLVDPDLAPDAIHLVGTGSGTIWGGLSTSGTNWKGGFFNELTSPVDLIFSAGFCPDGSLRLDSDGDLFTVTGDSLQADARWTYLGGRRSGSFPWDCVPPPSE